MFGFKKPYMFIIVMIAEEQKALGKVLTDARQALLELSNIATEIQKELGEEK